MVFDLAQHRIRGSFEHVDELVRESFEQITRMYESGGEMTGTPTGFRDIDQMTSGLQPGNLIVVAGRPSMGKSAFALGHGREPRRCSTGSRSRCSRSRCRSSRSRSG